MLIYVEILNQLEDLLMVNKGLPIPLREEVKTDICNDV